MIQPLSNSQKCLICENQGHGVHFGVLCCRACAMFFRRYWLQNKVFKCKDNSKFCKFPAKIPHLMCKSCRLKKCLEFGMNGAGSAPKSHKTLERAEEKVKMNHVERMEYKIWHPVTKKPIKWMDIAPIVRRSREILENFNPPHSPQFDALNPLQKMAFSLKKLRSGQKSQPKIDKTMNFDCILSNWEEFMTRTAEWLMHSEEFRELPNHEKLSFFKIVWAVWRRFERFEMGVRVFGRRSLEEKLFLKSDDEAVTVECFHQAVAHCEEDFKHYHNRMKLDLLQYFDAVVRPCLDFEFTDIEINYALCHITWIYASRKLLGQTLQKSELFLEKISENLHDYYTNERKLKNYAARLAGLMEMVNNVLKIQSNREKIMEMAFLFDAFNVMVSEPKFFSV